MYTYTIQSQQPRLVSSKGESSLFTKEEILIRHLTKCIFQVGDMVCFKRPKKNPVYGTIEEVRTDPDKIYWTHGGVSPCFLIVRTETGDLIATNYRRLKGVKYQCTTT